MSASETEPKLSIILDTLINISVAVIIFSIVYFFVAQPHQVDGRSMLPSFHHGDYVLTEKISKELRGLQRGDVIVFHYPENPVKEFIKRVIALPGDRIILQNGVVVVNDVPLQEPYLRSDRTSAHRFLTEGTEYTVPTDQLIVMGDNRGESSDSREWGPVPVSLVVGNVFFRYWPISRISFVNR